MLLDVQMPGIDGHELTRRIRAIPGFAGVPVIAVTAGGRSDQRSAALAAGMSAVIVKPVDLEALVAIIRQCLDMDNGTVAVPFQRGNNLSRHALRAEAGTFRRLFGVFEEEYSAFGIAAREAITKREFERVCAMMHKIGSAARHMGAGDLVEIASELEAAAAMNDPHCAELASRFEASLRSFINSGPTAK